MYLDVERSQHIICYIHEFTSIMNVKWVANDARNTTYPSCNTLVPKRKYVIIEWKHLASPYEDYVNSFEPTVNKTHVFNDVRMNYGTVYFEPLNIKHFKTIKLEDNHAIVLNTAFDKCMNKSKWVSQNFENDVLAHCVAHENISSRCKNRNGYSPFSQDSLYEQYRFPNPKVEGYYLNSQETDDSEKYKSFPDKPLLGCYKTIISFDAHDEQYDKFYKSLTLFMSKLEAYQKDDYKLFYEENC